MRKFGFTLALATLLTVGTLGQVSAQTGGVIVGDKAAQQCTEKTGVIVGDRNGVIVGDRAGVIVGDKIQECATEKSTVEYIWEQILGVIVGD